MKFINDFYGYNFTYILMKAGQSYAPFGSVSVRTKKNKKNKE
jgi:hypothetical protein